MLLPVIGIAVQTWSTDLPALTRYWTAADALGYAGITYGDGLAGFTHDGFTMLGALAAVTRRARIGPAATYCFDPSSHHPSWLAKRAVTVDHLSGGRLDLRLAVGAEAPAAARLWWSHGIRYPPAAERVARLDETIALLRALWRGEPVDYAGRWYTLHGARLAPAPLQRPAPPVWVAAMGRAALGVAARRADGWEASYLAPAAFEARWRAVQALLLREGRAPSALRRSVEVDVVLGRSRAAAEAARERFCAARAIDRRHPLLDAALVGTPDQIAETIGRYAAAGATDLMVGFADFPATDMLETFAERVLPALAGVPEASARR